MVINERFETNRLTIRSTKKEDTNFCLDIWLDDVMGKYLSDPPRHKAGHVYQLWQEQVEQYDGCYYFVSESKDKGRLIGTCSTVPNSDSTVWDLGYCVHHEYWRQGYATEMVRALIEFCRSKGAQVITADVAVDNEGSNRVLQNLGFHIIHHGEFAKSNTDLVFTKATYRLDL